MVGEHVVGKAFGRGAVACFGGRWCDWQLIERLLQFLGQLAAALAADGADSETLAGRRADGVQEVGDPLLVLFDGKQIELVENQPCLLYTSCPGWHGAQCAVNRCCHN